MSSGDENVSDLIDNLAPKKQIDPKKKKWKKIAKKANAKHKRTKSRLSNAVEKSFNENLENDEQNNSISSVDNIDNFSMLFLSINLVMGKVVKSITLLMGNTTKIEAVIPRAIKEFNEQFQKENLLFRLKADPLKYGLKASKKTGFPKTDMPSFNPKTTLLEANFTNFTLVWKENPSDFTIYFDKIHVKNKKLCDSGPCMIY